MPAELKVISATCFSIYERALGSGVGSCSTNDVESEEEHEVKKEAKMAVLEPDRRTAIPVGRRLNSEAMEELLHY